MLYPIIMAGGSGTRFWPRSRLQHPKQLIEIVGRGTMIQQTVARLQPGIPLASIRIITNAAQADGMREQLPDLAGSQIIPEPVGRDTAAAIGLGALLVRAEDPEGVMAVVSADHVIAPPERFQASLRRAAELASSRGLLVTFGVRPTAPSTLYGYLRRGAPLKGAPGAYELLAFKEKPDRATAEAFLESGDYYWNSGNFVWRAQDILEAIATFLPELYDGLERIRPALGTARQATVLEAEYPTLPKTSIDFGVMEKAPNVTVIEADFQWDDVGAWDALARHRAADEAGNVVSGTHCGLDTEACIIAGEEGHLLATIGVRNLVLVQTTDATLVCARDRAADVKTLVQTLKKTGLEAYT
jgi:mannose-1-phosphate guanylyltransferase